MIDVCVSLRVVSFLQFWTHVFLASQYLVLLFLRCQAQLGFALHPSQDHSKSINSLLFPWKKTSLKGGHSRWPQPVWPNQMASGITVHLLGIFVAILLLYDSTRTGCEALRLGRSSSLIWRSLGIHGWSDWRLKEILKASHIKKQTTRTVWFTRWYGFFVSSHLILARNVFHLFMLLGSRSKDSLHPQCSAALLIERCGTEERDVVVSE